MEHAVCLNTLSMPADDKESAYNMMLEACYGMLKLNTGSDRFALYFDDQKKGIYECMLADGYTYREFVNELEADHQYRDLVEVLDQALDRSPALDFLSDKDIEDLGDYAFYLPNAGYNKNMDILGIAWMVEGVLLSFSTHERWGITKVTIARWDSEANREERYPVRNISRESHGVEIRKEIESLTGQTLADICPKCSYTELFQEWYGKLDENNRRRVFAKIQLAAQRRFSGGEPLFKTLESGDGMREMRFSAYPGGAVRILFGALPNDQKAILAGFIKKSNSEGYEENMRRAGEFWKRMVNGE